jgi:UDP-glucose 4-epimerase
VHVAKGRRVLVTGIAGQLAGLLAHALEARDDVDTIVGVDVREPAHDLQRTRFVRANVRNPLVAKILADDEIDTVVHLSTAAGPGSVGGRARMKELNVIGAMQLFAACQNAPRLRRVVLKSTTAIYGAHHTDPALFREQDPPRVPPDHGFAKDATEIEQYARDLARRRDDLDLTVLRFANFLGPRLDSSFHALFTLPVVPSQLGFDPRLQFCHEQDAVDVLVRATTGDHPGTYNVAGDGVLYLSQCIRLAGRIAAPVPWPLTDLVASAVQRTRRIDITHDQLGFLRHGRAVDTTRLRDQMGVVPAYSTRDAFEDYVERRRIHGIVDRDQLALWQREAVDALQRRLQQRRLARRPRAGAR